MKPRLVSDRTTVGTRQPVDFEQLGVDGVNVFCENFHERIFVASLVLIVEGETDEEPVWALGPQADAHAVVDGLVEWERYRIACPECQRTVTARSATLQPVVVRLRRAGVASVTLSGLERILAGS